MIAAIEEKIQALVEQQRLQREREVLALAAKHCLTELVTAALIRFHFDHER